MENLNIVIDGGNIKVTIETVDAYELYLHDGNDDDLKSFVDQYQQTERLSSAYQSYSNKSVYKIRKFFSLS